MVVLGIDTMVMDNDEALKRHGVQPIYKRVKGFQPHQMSWGRYVVMRSFGAIKSTATMVRQCSKWSAIWWARSGNATANRCRFWCAWTVPFSIRSSSKSLRGSRLDTLAATNCTMTSGLMWRRGIGLAGVGIKTPNRPETMWNLATGAATGRAFAGPSIAAQCMKTPSSFCPLPGPKRSFTPIWGWGQRWTNSLRMLEVGTG